MLIFICLCSWSLTGVFGDEVKSLSVMEGDSVTLTPNDADIMGENLIMWTFGHNSLIAKINRKDSKRQFFDERFRDRLKLDQTGSLTITNTRITDSGLYQVLCTSKDTPVSIFNITVYAHLPVPVISNSSSSGPASKCVFLCSVVNVSDVTLSWYRGNSLLSSMSVSDLSRSLSLHLECLDDSYSCVVNNPISNQTQHLNTEYCEPCSVQTRDREITYTDPTFYKIHKSSATEQDNVVYAGVSRR
uniref:Ig-like domain-containing protein n=1 Tax=Cyprinus carpio carpio TaxID=630221 RepID=A0A9J7X3N2_CYPCA